MQTATARRSAGAAQPTAVKGAVVLQGVEEQPLHVRVLSQPPPLLVSLRPSDVVQARV